MKKLNESDKNELLGRALKDGENYKAKVWGCLMANAKTIMLFGAIGGAFSGAAGALSNEYCYVGLTDSKLVFIVMRTMDCSQVKGAFEIPFSNIDRVKVKKSLIPGRHVLKIYRGKDSLKLSLVTNTIGTDLKNQKEGVEAILTDMRRRYTK
ncbi:hypothetical protein [Anaeromicropila herbilytica]|uniref:YokE-like PH domain-containing protein n=1 Tax=Anaeromicropila herbilytica TaxID=2785025 RepID=A0A7R7EHG7_9FIRM|nr:hypothetical protein [Anaeromicropila herbilytica]BCN29320.1 hypothetical protein bsdtb5_06150 [Anaeromicropila herbilytica]